LGQHPVGLVALAIHESVDAALESVAQLGEQQRHQSGGEQRDAGVAGGSDQPVEPADDEDVHGELPGGGMEAESWKSWA
jgi:hypothetical protein